MKCIYCGTNGKYSERKTNGGRCVSCSHLFAYEPMSDPYKITDGFFQNLIKRVSSDGATRFTERQLWYELLIRIDKKPFWKPPWGGRFGISLAGVVVGLPLSGAFPPIGVPIVIGSVAGCIYSSVKNRKEPFRRPPPIRLSFEEFRANYLQKWISVHGAIAGLLPPVVRARALERPLPSELLSYSFDRAVVVDRAETAAMLIANNFHFENNCAILTPDGYPEDVFGVVMEMLRGNPNLEVFTVHDASREGAAVPAHLRAPGWFPDRSVRIVDLGLLPEHAIASNLPVLAGLPGPLDPAVRARMSHSDSLWLESGQQVELAALRPAKLMRAIFQGITRAGHSRQSGRGDEFDQGGMTVWIHDPAIDFYAADSFG